MRGFGFQQSLRNASEKRHIAVHPDTDELGGQRRHLAAQGGCDVLRMDESAETGLSERIDGYDLRPSENGGFEGAEHARVIGSRVLTNAKDGVRFGEIIEGDSSFAHADSLPHREAAGLVTHVRTVRQIVGAVAAGEELIEKGGFVARAA